MRLLPGIPNRPLIRSMLRLGIWPDSKQYNRKAGRLLLPEFGATVWMDRDFGLLAEAGGLVFPIESWRDLRTVQEVVTDEVYASLRNFQTDKPIVAWDVGMNIGAASLWLALRDGVSAVYAYEPFPHTYDLALQSISLNPSLATKINASNVGLGGADEEVTAEYSPLYKESVSAGAVPIDLRKEYNLEPDQIQTLKVKIRDASTVLMEILANHEGSEILAKIDCEGAEYDIVSTLKRHGLLRHIAAAEIECHGGRTDEIRSQLIESGFNFTEDVIRQGDIDLIHAVRSSASPQVRATNA